MAYGILEGIEAVGLWYTKRWAEYLTFIATTILLPLEIYEIIHRQSALKIIGFIINVAVVVYLLYAKRLFGLRGGGRADEEVRARDMSWETIERVAPPVAARRRSRRGDRDRRRARGRDPADRRARWPPGFPSSRGHPVRALDARAMELASRDRELKAALFRFVDVVPACRSLDDLARHLTGFLEEVPDASPPITAAMQIANTKAGRAALGAAAAGGVKHMAHRFIVGETPAAALGVLRGLWERGVASTVDLLGEATVTDAEADRYAGRCTDALEQLARESTRWPARPMLEHDTTGPLARANVSVKVSALTPLLRPDAPALGREDAGRRLRPLLRRAHELGAHIHIDMESLDSREAVLELVLARALRGRVPGRARRPASCSRPTCAIRPSSSTTILDWAQRTERTPPLTIRLVKGAYWDHELVQAASTGGRRRCSRSRPTATATSRPSPRRLVDARPPSASRSPRTTSARSPTRSRSTGRPAAPITTSSSRCCAGSATSSRTRSRRSACACARTVRSAISSPGWRISCGGCSRTRATSRSCTSRRAGCRSRQLLAAP